MDLVVARANLALAIDHEAAVGDLAVVGQHRERPDMKPDAVGLGRLAAGGEHQIFVLAPQILARALLVAIEQAGHFGREQHFRAARGGFGDRIDERARIGLRIDAACSTGRARSCVICP